VNDLFTATAQRNITMIWLVGFFAIITAQGLGFLKSVPNDIYTLTAVVLFFWFNRSRQGQAPDPERTTVTQTTESVTTPSKPETLPHANPPTLPAAGPAPDDPDDVLRRAGP